jgi:hypothetical protein
MSGPVGIPPPAGPSQRGPDAMEGAPDVRAGESPVTTGVKITLLRR